ncbi:hypothetical protein AB0O42_05545 [Streptomyces sp. NPDC089922]|uniref:hypothetical protein n=1 Tax=Streptomyces sp. NPDC089922 TaxID=3155189 RepID=UPI0034224AC6
MDSMRVGDIVVDGRRSQVGRISEMPEPETLTLVRPPGAQKWTAQRAECWYASVEEAQTITGEVVERVITGRERPALPRRRG